MDFPDGTTVDFLVWTGRKGDSAADVYDTAQYGLAAYDGSSDVNFRLYQSKVMSVDIRRGKDAFLKRFRTGTAKLELDNESGEFTTGVFLPGDYVWIQAYRYYPPEVPGGPIPIPNGTEWQDSTGRTWTVNGDGATLDGDPGLFVQYSLFYGRVDYAEDIVKGGVDVTKVRCVDGFADLAVIDRDAESSQGAGETTADRITRIINNVGQGFTPSFKWPTVATMQATTLAGQPLGELQLTMDSEGGDLWMRTGPNANDGSSVEYAGRDWLTEAPRSTEVQWTLGGGAGIPIMDARIMKDGQLVVNDATFATTGGTAQNVQDSSSIQRYGRRTTRRLDLICVGDAQPGFLAARAVNNLALLRPRVRQVVVPADTLGAVELGHDVQFGDLTTVIVESINGWSYGFQAHVIGIAHSMWHDQWFITLTLDDAFVANVDGPYSYAEFDEAYSLGGHPVAAQIPNVVDPEASQLPS